MSENQKEITVIALFVLTVFMGLFLIISLARAQIILPTDPQTHFKRSTGYLEGTQGAYAIKCIMGEARGEGYKGMVAVGEALRNRGTMKGAYGCHAKFAEPHWVWDMAEKAWIASEHSNLVNGATHWESTDYEVPYWAASMTETAHIGKHIFYKETQ